MAKVYVVTRFMGITLREIRVFASRSLAEEYQRRRDSVLAPVEIQECEVHTDGNFYHPLPSGADCYET